MTFPLLLPSLALTRSVRAVIDRRLASAAIPEPNPAVRTDGKLRLRCIRDLRPRRRRLRENGGGKSNRRSGQEKAKQGHEVGIRNGLNLGRLSEAKSSSAL